ncbi:MAG: hypothetical protein JXR14_04245 [Paracoccaceae bacterium]
MADYSDTQDSLAAKGLLLALILLGVFVLALALFGGGHETPGAIGNEVGVAGEERPRTVTDPQN